MNHAEFIASTRTRTIAERITDGEPLIGLAHPSDLVDAVVETTHRLHDVVEDHGERSAQADDLRARRRRCKAELVRRAT